MGIFHDKPVLQRLSDSPLGHPDQSRSRHTNLAWSCALGKTVFTVRQVTVYPALKDYSPREAERQQVWGCKQIWPYIELSRGKIYPSRKLSSSGRACSVPGPEGRSPTPKTPAAFKLKSSITCCLCITQHDLPGNGTDPQRPPSVLPQPILCLLLCLCIQMTAVPPGSNSIPSCVGLPLFYLLHFVHDLTAFIASCSGVSIYLSVSWPGLRLGRISSS